jgi:hypothetical protein
MDGLIHERSVGVNRPTQSEWDKTEWAREAAILLIGEDRYHEAYKLFRKAMCGFSDTADSPHLTWYVKTRMREFCCGPFCSGAFGDKIANFQTVFERIFESEIRMTSAAAGLQLAHVASATQDQEPARRLRKKALFLMLVERGTSEDLECAIQIEMEQLGIDISRY